MYKKPGAIADPATAAVRASSVRPDESRFARPGGAGRSPPPLPYFDAAAAAAPRRRVGLGFDQAPPPVVEVGEWKPLAAPAGAYHAVAPPPPLGGGRYK